MRSDSARARPQVGSAGQAMAAAWSIEACWSTFTPCAASSAVRPARSAVGTFARMTFWLPVSRNSTCGNFSATRRSAVFIA